MKVVVSGATGFIGSHLAADLKKKGHEVVGMAEAGQGEAVSGAGVMPVDIVSGRGLDESLRGVDVAIHLAARNHVLKERSANPLAEYRKVNVEGTRNFARAAVRNGARLFVHFSSVKAMGEESERVLTEDSHCTPITPYGISKRESEDAARAELAGTGTGLVILRLPMVYGPGNKGNLPRMIRWAQRRLPFPMFQPDNLRSMIYVGNVVAAVIVVMETFCSESSEQRTYIIKDDADYSMRMIYSSICRELGKIPRFLPLPAVLGRFAGAISEDFRKVTSSFRVSSAKIREEIGFVPPVSLEEGIARTVKCYKRSVQ
jgi:UDP-glucose 4-epimerase